MATNNSTDNVNLASFTTTGSGDLAGSNGAFFTSEPSITGFTDGSTASAGNVGYVLTASVLDSAGISMTSGTARNIITLTVTEGVWDFWANVAFDFAVSGQSAYAWLNTTSATKPDNSNCAIIDYGAAGMITSVGLTIPFFNVTTTTTRTLYLSAVSTFTSTLKCSGFVTGRIRA